MWIFKLLFSVLNSLRRWATLVVLLLMLSFTVASHTIEAVYAITRDTIAMVSGVASSALPGGSSRRKMMSLDADLQRERALTVDLRQQNKRLTERNIVTFRGERMTIREATANTLDGVGRRTRSTAAANIGSMFGEGIPFYGIAIIVASTGYELKSACDSISELHELQISLDPESATTEDRDEICGATIPTKDEIWQKIKSSPAAAWESALSVLEAAPGWVGSLTPPDFRGGWERATGWFNEWL